jgi:hypothetical protein
LIVAKAKEVPPALRRAVFKAIDERKTRWFDSHPCDSERFEHVQSIQATPMVRCDLPAKRLFSNFGALCRQTSEAEYRSALKEKFNPASLVPTARLIAERAGERQAFEALQRFYQGQVIASRPILPEENSWQSIDSHAASKESLRQSRDKMMAALAELGGRPAEFERRAVALAITRGKIALASAVGTGRKVGVFRRGAEADAMKLVGEQNAAALAMMDFEDSAQVRLTTALRLVQVPDITRQLIAAGCPQPIQRAEKLARVLDALSPSIPSVQTARTFSIILRVLIASYNPKQPHRGIAERMVTTTRELNVLLRKIRDQLSGVAYPFGHAIQGVSVGASLIDEEPAADAILPTLRSAETLVERFHTVLYRTLAGATELSERIETVLGMAPLADPKPLETGGAEDDSAAEKQRSRSFWIWYSARAASGLALLFGLILLAGAGAFAPTQPAATIQPQSTLGDAGVSPAISPPAQPQAPTWPQPPASPQIVAEPSAPDPMVKDALDRLNAMTRQMQEHMQINPVRPGLSPVQSPPVPSVAGSHVSPPAAMSEPHFPDSAATSPPTAAPPAPSLTSFVASQRKMHAIRRAIMIWRSTHDWQYPDSLEQLIDAGLLTDAASLQTPGDPVAQFQYIKPQPDSPHTAILLYDPSVYQDRPGPAILLGGPTLSLPTADAMKARIAQDSGQQQ